MITLGDPKNKGYVDIKDFMLLMRQIGLTQKNHDKNESDLDREYR